MEGQSVNIETWCGNLQNAQTEGQEKNRGNITSYLLTCLKKLGAVQNGLLCQWQYSDLMCTNIFSES